MFQFPPFASLLVVRIITLQVIGLSHSEIAGSRVICTYPALIAAYHVLKASTRRPCSLSPIKLNNLPAGSKLPAANYSLLAHTFSCIEIY